MKKTSILLLSLGMILSQNLYSQTSTDSTAMHTLIAQYQQAREKQDTVLLKEILTSDIDQLVSSGVWRRGIRGAVAGMMRSSGRNPGKRTLTVEHVRFITKESGIVDARYEIERADGSVRRMWSTFIVVEEEGKWKIAGIRNMLPAG